MLLETTLREAAVSPPSAPIRIELLTAWTPVIYWKSGCNEGLSTLMKRPGGLSLSLPHLLKTSPSSPREGNHQINPGLTKKLVPSLPRRRSPLVDRESGPSPFCLLLSSSQGVMSWYVMHRSTRCPVSLMWYSPSVPCVVGDVVGDHPCSACP